MKRLLLCMLVGASVLACAAQAADFPDRPIRIIVPYSPGASTDTVTRLIAVELQRKLHQGIIVENKAGAGGLIGVDALARAEPDGYTIGLGTEATHVTAPLMKKEMPFDPLKAFTPLTVAIHTTMAIAINPRVLPVHSLKELIEYSKKPGGVSFGTPGFGTPQHLIGELLKQRSGGNFIHVPYKGSGNATTDLIAGHIPMVITTLPSLLPHLQSIRILAIGDAVRLKSMPDVATISETLPDFVVTGWSGYFGPAALPQPIADRLSQALVAALHEPKIMQAIRNQGLEPAGTSAAELTQDIVAGMKRWRAVIDHAGLEKMN